MKFRGEAMIVVNEWRHVELPPEDQATVLVWDKDMVQVVMAVFREWDGDPTFVDLDGYVLNAVAWMPLPPKPKWVE